MHSDWYFLLQGFTGITVDEVTGIVVDGDMGEMVVN